MSRTPKPLPVPTVIVKVGHLQIDFVHVDRMVLSGKNKTKDAIRLDQVCCSGPTNHVLFLLSSHECDGLLWHPIDQVTIIIFDPTDLYPSTCSLSLEQHKSLA